MSVYNYLLVNALSIIESKDTTKSKKLLQCKNFEPDSSLLWFRLLFDHQCEIQTVDHFRSWLQAFFHISRLHVISSGRCSRLFVTRCFDFAPKSWLCIIFVPSSKSFLFCIFATSCCFVRLSVVFVCIPNVIADLSGLRPKSCVGDREDF